MNYEILFATNNKHKLEEVRNYLSPYGIIVYGLSDVLLDVKEPDETGSTYRENALIKASAYKDATTLPIVSDDSGLEVAALGNIPGINSARFAAEKGGHDAAMNYIINELNKYEDRSARFICEIVVLNIGDRPLFFQGIANGEIISEKDGEKGFGYDPIFFSHEANKTFANLTNDEKNMYSHRGKALKKFLTMLQLRGFAKFKKVNHHHDH